MRLVRCGNTTDPDWYAGHRNKNQGYGLIRRIFQCKEHPASHWTERDKDRILAAGRIAHMKRGKGSYVLSWQTSDTKTTIVSSHFKSIKVVYKIQGENIPDLAMRKTHNMTDATRDSGHGARHRQGKDKHISLKYWDLYSVFLYSHDFSPTV